MNFQNDDETMGIEIASESTATVNGLVNSIMLEHRMLNISRDAIKVWGRDAATLDFIAEEDIDISQLEEGMDIQFTFHLVDEGFVITDINTDLQSSLNQAKE